MQIGFILPSALWLLLLLLPIWALTLGTPRRLERWRFWSGLAIRTLALTGLVLALAGIQLRYPIDTVTTVFLLDGSDSISLSQRARAETFIQQAITEMTPDDQAAIVVFGQQALVERIPSQERIIGKIAAQPGGGATNIQQALQLGLALLPAEGHQRLVLLSDGGENAGDALTAVRTAQTQGVPIDIVSLSGIADGPDAQVSAIEIPVSTRRGQQLRMRIDLESNTAATGRLSVQGPGDSILLNQIIELPAGARRVEVALPDPPFRFNRYIVRIELPDDARPENNAAEAYSFVSDQPRVLLVEGSAQAAAPLAGALQAAEIEVDILPPERIPTSIGELSNYDAVILINVPKAALPQRALSTLPAFVHDLGRGLMMVGGPDSFGAGSWRDTPIEGALPVSMDIPSHMQFPPVSIVVLIDVSGSMAADEGGRPKIAIAAEGAQQLAALLRDNDELTIIPFDSEPRGVIGPFPGSERDKAIDALNNLHSVGGGINIHDGLVEAAKYIRQSTKPIRHIITITDGSDTVQQEGALDIVRQLNSEHVTLSSIAVGQGDHVQFIQSMAKTGTGRTFLANQAADIPPILVDEAQVVLKPYIVEKTFVPLQSAPHVILRDITHLPQLHAYVATSLKQTAQVLLSSPDGEPILASWQYGLGRALAWTSDFSGQWGKDWVIWDKFPHFSAQLLAWLLPQQSEQNLALQTSSLGGSMVLNAHAYDPLGRAQTSLQISGYLLAGDGTSIPVALREVGPGEYRATVSDARPGSYLVQLVAQDARGHPVGMVTAGAIMPPSAEHRRHTANVALLEAIARTTGGRLDPQPSAAFLPNRTSQSAVREIGFPLLWMALILLPFDIALRRLMVGPRKVIEVLKIRPDRPDRSYPQVENGNQPAVNTSPGLSSNQTNKRTEQAGPSPHLERLREVQERARRRARGEE